MNGIGSDGKSFIAPIDWHQGDSSSAAAHWLEHELRTAITCSSHIADYLDIACQSKPFIGDQLAIENERFELERAFRSIAAALGMTGLLKQEKQ